MTEEPRDEAADDAAADWLVRLAAHPQDGGLRAGFAAWHAAAPAHARAWARAQRLDALLGQVAPQHAGAWGGGWAARPAPAVRRRRIWRAGGAMAAMAAMVAGLAWLPGLALSLQADFADTGTEVRQVVLADGSQVSLAPDSAIDVRMDGTERRVRLLRGEAYFEVVHDPAHPFRVEADGAVATVLGTGFDVRDRDDAVAVAVRHGHVRVDAPAGGGMADLHAGDWVRLQGGRMTRGSTDPGEVAAWRTGRLVARDLPLRAVVAELRRSFHGVILVRADRFAAVRVNGVYDLADPARTLGELAAAHKAVVHHLSPWLLVVTGG